MRAAALITAVSAAVALAGIYTATPATPATAAVTLTAQVAPADVGVSDYDRGFREGFRRGHADGVTDGKAACQRQNHNTWGGFNQTEFDRGVAAGYPKGYDSGFDWGCNNA